MNIINLTRQKGIAVLATAAMLFSLLWSASPVLAAPAVPVIATPTQSTTTDPIVLTGTADANVGITVTGGEDAASATSSASGDWSVMVDLNDESLNVLSVVAIDAVGSTSPAATVEITHTAAAAVDVTDPVFDVTADISATTTASAGATVNFTVTATDDTDASVTVVCTPASGSTFPVGTTTVTCTAEDDAGNTATTSFEVVVDLVDDIDLPVDVDLDIEGPFCSADATVTLTGTTDTGSTVLIVGASGTTTATLTGGSWSADLDLTATSSLNTFEVIVLDAGGDVITSEEIDIAFDTTAPEITVNGDATVNIDIGEEYVDLGATATDNLDATITVASTTDLDINAEGSYTITYTATDCAGNVDVETRVVVVNDDDDDGGSDRVNRDDDDDDDDSDNDNDSTGGSDDDDDDTFIGGPSTFPNIVRLAGAPLVLPQIVTTPAPQVLGASVAYVPGMPSTGADVSETAKMAFLLSGMLAVGMYLTASKRKMA